MPLRHRAILSCGGICGVMVYIVLEMIMVALRIMMAVVGFYISSLILTLPEFTKLVQAFPS